MPIVVDAELQEIVLSTLRKHGPTSIRVDELADRCGLSERLTRAVVRTLPAEIKREDLYLVSLIPAEQSAEPELKSCSKSAERPLGNPFRESLKNLPAEKSAALLQHLCSLPAGQSAEPLRELCSTSAAPLQSPSRNFCSNSAERPLGDSIKNVPQRLSTKPSTEITAGTLQQLCSTGCSNSAERPQRSSVLYEENTRHEPMWLRLKREKEALEREREWQLEGHPQVKTSAEIDLILAQQTADSDVEY